jgi:tetrahydromethanopterin S-methyltransferase subunit G
MSVMEPREKWTDERLDDLSRKVDDGFARVDSDIRELRVEVKHQGASLRAEMSAGFQRVETNLEKKIGDTKADLEKRIDGIKRDLSIINRTIYGAVATLIVAQLANSALF